MMTETEKKITNLARKINRQINKLAIFQFRREKNIWITEDGRILEIRNHADVDNAVEDSKRVLDDMLRQLDELVKERDDETAINEENTVQDKGRLAYRILHKRCQQVRPKREPLERCRNQEMV